MSADALITALNLPASARVDQRVPKKLLLEHGAPTAADRRLINEGIEAILWLATLKPATCGISQFRDETREYLEIAVLRMTLRDTAKQVRLVELLHRAVPYPVLLIVETGADTLFSLAHKRRALNEAEKFVLENEPVSVRLAPEDADLCAHFLRAVDLARQPQASLLALYQGWMDTALALCAARLTGTFVLYDSAERSRQRREALHASLALQERIANLHRAATKASQLVRQVELNLEIKRLRAELSAARALL